MSIDILLDVVAAAAALVVLEAMPDMAILIEELMLLAISKKESLGLWQISKKSDSATRRIKDKQYVVGQNKYLPPTLRQRTAPLRYPAQVKKLADFPCNTCR